MTKKTTKRKPKFKRPESFRYKRLEGGWRKPKGMHNKIRKAYAGKPASPNIGYRRAADERGVHPSGYKEVLVHNPSSLDGLDKERQAVRIAGAVGSRKALLIMERGEELGLKILNPRRLPPEEEEGEEVEEEED